MNSLALGLWALALAHGRTSTARHSAACGVVGRQFLEKFPILLSRGRLQPQLLSLARFVVSCVCYLLCADSDFDIFASSLVYLLTDQLQSSFP